MPLTRERIIQLLRVRYYTVGLTLVLLITLAAFIYAADWGWIAANAALLAFAGFYLARCYRLLD